MVEKLKYSVWIFCKHMIVALLTCPVFLTVAGMFEFGQTIQEAFRDAVPAMIQGMAGLFMAPILLPFMLFAFFRNPFAVDVYLLVGIISFGLYFYLKKHPVSYVCSSLAFSCWVILFNAAMGI